MRGLQLKVKSLLPRPVVLKKDTSKKRRFRMGSCGCEEGETGEKTKGKRKEEGRVQVREAWLCQQPWRVVPKFSCNKHPIDKTFDRLEGFVSFQWSTQHCQSNSNPNTETKGIGNANETSSPLSSGAATTYK